MAGVVGFVVALSAVMYFDYWWNKPSPVPALQKWEIDHIARLMDIQFLTTPKKLTTWFSCDAGYSLNVEAVFEIAESDVCYEASWFADAHRVNPADAVREFQSPVPAFANDQVNNWQPLPLKSDDLIYRQLRKEAGVLESERWALIRAEGGYVTMYIVQKGNESEIEGMLMDILTREPIDLGWFPGPDGIYIRSGP